MEPITNLWLPESLRQISGLNFFQRLIPTVVTLGLVASVLIFFFMLLMGGIQWMLAAGDKTKLEGARGRITGALIGIFLVFAIFAIVSLVEYVFGVQMTTVCIPTIVKPNCTVGDAIDVVGG